MSLLSRVEGLFEAVVEGGFRRLFSPPLQPIEVARALERLMRTQTVVGPDSVDVPNVYCAYLHPNDFARFQPLQPAVEAEVVTHLERRAAEERFRPVGPVRVRLAADPAVRRSFVRSEARFETPAGSAPAANLEDTRRLEMVSPPASAILLAGEDGQELRVGIGSVRIGRGLDNDFIVRDVRVSRHHASMDHDGQHWLIRDLESTNGTYVAGERVRQAAIDSATEVSLGGYRLSVRPVETRRAD